MRVAPVVRSLKVPLASPRHWRAIEMGRAARLAHLALFALAGCGEAHGALTVLLDPEDAITRGIEPGEATENVRDGWAVAFDKYIVAVGDIDLHLVANEAVEAEASEVFVVDLVALPADGEELWTFGELTPGRWDFHYATPGANAGATRHESVTRSDFDELVENDWTYLIDGVLLNTEGQSCPPANLARPGAKAPNGNASGDNDCYDASSIRFVFGVNAATRFGPCEIDALPGVAVSAAGTQTVAVTIHGDHLFFNGFPEGDESGVMRLAQWLADADLDLDGTVTADELESIAPSDLPELDDRFQLGGSPITPLTNLYEYVAGQLKTQGHFQGEGECLIDGVAHDHD